MADRTVHAAAGLPADKRSSAVRCCREDEVVAAAVSRRWHVADEDVKQHAAVCPICSDVAAVALLLSADQERARSDARVPAAGQVWWRAAVRARLEATQTVARPLTWLHGIASACAVGLACALVGSAWPALRDTTAWLMTQTLGADSQLGGVTALVTAAMQSSLPVAFGVAAFIVLAPLALYFALADD